MLQDLLRAARWLPAERAEAHCDIPCGIYDPITAKIAAQTVQKMVLRIQALPQAGPNETPQQRSDRENKLARYTQVKEEHATLCKRELDILWHDYFNPTHLQRFPDVHTTFWQAAKLASKCKQEVNMDAAKQLVGEVDKIAGIFWATKNVNDWKDAVAEVRFGT